MPRLIAIKRHKYITWHLPGDTYEAKESDAAILMARGLSRLAAIPVKPEPLPKAVTSYKTRDSKSGKTPKKTRRRYKRRDMKAEEC
jgi:hypothetical protein